MNTCRLFGIGVTLVSLALPGFSAISGCNNGYLLGNYDAQVANFNLQNVLQAVNSGGAVVTPSGTPAAAVVGFGSNPRSLSGSMPGASRFYFDGAGAIVGQTAVTGGGTVSVAV